MYRLYLKAVAAIPKDKLLHFTGGMLLLMGFSLFFSPIASLVFSLALMIFKELVDWAIKEKPTLADAHWDVVAGFLGSLVVLIWMRLM